MTLKLKRRSRYARVTWDGRIMVNVDGLYKSKRVQQVVQEMDAEKQRPTPKVSLPQNELTKR